MFKNVASQKLWLFAFDAATGLAKTGDAANLTPYVSKDHGAANVLGDTSATELDATNAKGFYWFDLTQSETNADTLLFTGKSATANVVVVGRIIYPRPPNASSLVIDSSGRVDVSKMAGTSLTARDIGASVLLSSGTGTGQLDFTSGVVKASLAQILGTALTETAGQIAAGFKKLFDVAVPVLTAASVNQTGDNYARLGAPAGASHAADVAAVKVDTAAIKAKTDNLPSDPADASDIAALVDALPTGSEAATALLDAADSIETGLTVRKALRLLTSVIGGKLSGAATPTNTFRNAVADSKARVTSTVDADGNRTAVAVDLT